MPNATANKRVTRRLLEVFEHGRLEEIDTLVDPGFINHEAPPGSPQGPEGLRQTITWLRGLWGPMQAEIQDEICEADKVVARVVMHGHHLGEFLGHAPTGKEYAAKQIHIWRLNNGKAVEHWSVRDDLGQAPAARPHRKLNMSARASIPPDKLILLRGEQTDGALSVIESTMPPHAPGPPLHKHDFHEAFYVLDGELTIQVEDELHPVGRGELAIAPRNVPHTLANQHDAPTRFLIICTPAGFERQLARRAAAEAGTEPPDWMLQPTPAVTHVGPRIGAPYQTQHE